MPELDGSGTLPLALLEVKAAYTFDFAPEDLGSARGYRTKARQAVTASLGRPVAGNHQGPRPTL
ncbi:hypothetical protein [Streptomyces sp. MN13]